VVDAQTAGPLAELARQLAQNDRQTAGAEGLTGGYFQQLGKQPQSGVDQTGQIASGLNSTLTGIGNDTQSRLQGIGQDQMASLRKYTPAGEGAGLNTGAMGSLATEIARQQGLAAQNAGTYRAFGAQSGANLNQLAASNLGTFALRGQETLGKIGQAGQLKNAPLSSKIAALQASKGGLLATALGKLRQQEIANSISKAGILTKEQIAALNAQTSTANSARAQAGADARNAATIKGAAARNAASISAADARNAANNAFKQAAINAKNAPGARALTHSPGRTVA
jgi:hypothetical protein